MTELSQLVPVPGPLGFAIDWPQVEEALEGLVSSRTLAATRQDASVHAEGDVWAHTRLVLEALTSSSEWRALDQGQRGVTFVAALAHDVGKASTTRADAEGRLSSRGHSGRGEQLVRHWLWRLGANFADREHVCRLIRNHQAPFYALERENPPYLAARLSLGLTNRLLVTLALADARGRRCVDAAAQARMVENCELYGALCEEEGVLDGPKDFASEHTRVVWCESGGQRAPEVAAFDDTTCELTLMSGLPAAGKDTWLETHCPQLEVVSLDALRELHDVAPTDDQGWLVQTAREAARSYLRAGRSFAWNATTLSAQFRSQVIELARSYRARVHLVYCEAGPRELAARNGSRRDPVPAAAVKKMLERWSVPLPDEAHRVTYAVMVSP